MKISVIALALMLLTSTSSFAATTALGALLEGAPKAKIQEVHGYDDKTSSRLQQTKKEILAMSFADFLGEAMQVKRSHCEALGCGNFSQQSTIDIRPIEESQVVLKSDAIGRALTMSERYKLVVIKYAVEYKGSERDHNDQSIEKLTRQVLDIKEIEFTVLQERIGDTFLFTYALLPSKGIVVRNGKK